MFVPSCWCEKRYSLLHDAGGDLNTLLEAEQQLAPFYIGSLLPIKPETLTAVDDIYRRQKNKNTPIFHTHFLPDPGYLGLKILDELTPMSFLQLKQCANHHDTDEKLLVNNEWLCTCMVLNNMFVHTEYSFQLSSLTSTYLWTA